MKTSLLLTVAFLFFFNFVYADPPSKFITKKEVRDIESRLNKIFFNEIKQSGYHGFKIVLDEDDEGYAGGVKIENQKILFSIGIESAAIYTLPILRFIACHELGHYLAGPPYKIGTQYAKNSKISSEGQSDYWAAQECLPKLGADPISDAENFFDWIYVSLKPFSENNPFYDLPKRNVIDHNFYDSEYVSLQCRMNTIEAGFLKQVRPRCWYPPAAKIR